MHLISGLAGMVAQSLAIDFPERVHGLVLVSIGARPDAYLSACLKSGLRYSLKLDGRS